MVLRVSYSINLSIEVQKLLYGNLELSISLKVVAERYLLVFNIVLY